MAPRPAPRAYTAAAADATSRPAVADAIGIRAAALKWLVRGRSPHTHMHSVGAAHRIRLYDGPTHPAASGRTNLT